MQMIINILVFLLILTTIVTVHEFGHFIAAKFFGVYCGAFSIGMGPKIFAKKGKETEFQIRAIPIGGFVTMAGEADQEENEDFKDIPVERSLKGKKTYQKLIIFLAGVFNNFLLAVIILMCLSMTVGLVPADDAKIGAISKGSVAEKASIQVGDTITKVENITTSEITEIKDFNDLTKALTAKGNDPMQTFNITVIRNGQELVIPVTAELNSDTHRYLLGVTQASKTLGFVDSLKYTMTTFGQMALLICSALASLVTRFASTVHELSGPVGIYSITADVTQSGQFSELFYLMALLSVNIGVFNLMPIPGLDGAQALFAIAEGIMHREIPVNTKAFIQFIGLTLVLALMLFVTYQDIIRLLG